MLLHKVIFVQSKLDNLVKLVDGRVQVLRTEIAEHDADLERAAEHIEQARLLIRRATAQTPAIARSLGTVGAAIEAVKGLSS